jgi:P4 family phage/plasmid primase-like protien
MNNLEPNAYHDVDFDSDETITAKARRPSESENETSESAENDQTTPIEITLIENDRGPVNKTITLGPNGEIQKTGVANIWSGKLFRVPLIDWRYMALGLEGLRSNHAIALGRLRADLGNEAYLTTANNKAELALPSRISRTKGNIIYEAGKPAPVAIDFDDGGMPQSVRDQIKDRGGLIPALESICEGLDGAAYISRGSTSSGLTIDATGKRKEGGSHHFVILTDGAVAQRFLEDMFDRAWLNGLGWILVGTAGTLLVRSIIDKCGWDPIRIVFEASPSVGPGLSQDPRPAVIHEGTPLVCPPPLTKAEKAKVARLIKAAKEEAETAGKRQREIWSAGHLDKMLAAGVSPEEAEKTLDQWAQGVLLDDAIIDFVNLGEVTVREILTDPEKYDGEKCHHPVEGQDYVAPGKFYADSKVIYTFGHGGQTFKLKGEKDSSVSRALVAFSPQAEGTEVKGPSDDFPELPTDTDNARRLVRLNLGDVRFSHPLNSWFIWTGDYWRPDTSGEIIRRAQHSVELLFREAYNEPPGDKRNSLYFHAIRSQKRKEIDNAVALARSDARAIIDYKLFDADPLLVGVQNGVIDLRTGKFRKARREDYITMRCNVEYDPSAKCPNWVAFQEKIAGMHPGLIEYKQRAHGLLLSGEVPEILFIAHGGGSNGKTTELECASQILGDYAHAADASLLVTAKEAGGPTPEIVALRGKRAIFINETAQSDWLNEQRVKYLAGTDTMSGRGLHQSPINWQPTHKPWLRTNHKPKVRGTDHGLWRRIHYIPFTATISEENKNVHFREECLVPELAGIFNWMLAGWMAYLAAGRKLNPPPCVQEAIAQYKSESDITGKWVAAACFHDSKAPRISGRAVRTLRR